MREGGGRGNERKEKGNIGGSRYDRAKSSEEGGGRKEKEGERREEEVGEERGGKDIREQV